MSCSAARRLLSAFVDSELSPDEMLQVRHHVFECAECSAECESLRKAKGSLSALAAPRLHADLLDLIACRPWDTGDDSTACRTRAGLPIFRRKYFPAVAAVLALSLSVGVGLVTSGFSRMTPQASLAESFNVEHQRARAASPLSGSPDTVELGQLAYVGRPLVEFAGTGSRRNLELEAAFVTFTAK